jgi:hypothetical protein
METFCLIAGQGEIVKLYTDFLKKITIDLSDVGGPSKGWMRKGEEGCSIETAMYSVYILDQERNHVT